MREADEIIIKFIIKYYKENRFYPSYGEIAKGVNRTKSTVHSHMKRLEDAGILIRKSDCSPHYRLINMKFILEAERHPEISAQTLPESPQGLWRDNFMGRFMHLA